MFRKYYKMANDDIKPDEEFVNSVIRGCKSRRPPAYRRYVKYAASAAVMAAVVSAAVISMPLWNRVDNDDGVIEMKTEYTSADSLSDTTENDVQTDVPEQPTIAPAADKADENASGKASDKVKATDKPLQKAATKPAASGKTDNSKSDSTSASRGTTAVGSSNEAEKNVFSPSVQNQPHVAVSGTTPPLAEKEAPEENQAEPVTDENPSAKENTVATSSAMQESVSMSASDENAAENHVYESKIMSARSVNEDSADDGATIDVAAAGGLSSSNAKRKDAETDMTLSAALEADDSAYQDYDIPCPDGYYCTAATGSGYTFENGEGAVIKVRITYGGEDYAPLYETDGDHIRASYASGGMRVSVSAYGAQMSSVEEIINSFIQ